MNEQIEATARKRWETLGTWASRDQQRPESSDLVTVANKLSRLRCSGPGRRCDGELGK